MVLTFPEPVPIGDISEPTSVVCAFSLMASSWLSSFVGDLIFCFFSAPPPLEPPPLPPSYYNPAHTHTLTLSTPISARVGFNDFYKSKENPKRTIPDTRMNIIIIMIIIIQGDFGVYIINTHTHTLCPLSRCA